MTPWTCRLLAVSAPLISYSQIGFNLSVISNVREKALQSMTFSWEIGTTAEALTELSWPSLAVFDPRAFPPPSQLNATLNASDVLDIAYKTVAAIPAKSLALISNQSSVGDPASIGNAVLLANWTRTDLSNTTFENAAGNQLLYLLHYAPRTNEGAISHVVDQVQLWADFIYMVPPFIAYFGVLQGGNGEPALLQIAYDQCRLYRDALRDDNGLWRHVTYGSWQDDTHWATGNAWAAAGMLRVLATLDYSSQRLNFVEQRANLTYWIEEIITAAWQYQQSNGTLLNVIDDPNSFADSASTALLASVTYRMAVFTNNTSLVHEANMALLLVQASVDAEGWLHNTVDPYTFNTPMPPGNYSPEGQAFVLLVHSAWRDFIDAFSKFK